MVSRYATSTAKSMIERVLAALLLAGLSPLMLACAIAVLLGDGWPAFYAGIRVGRHGRLFRQLKFRTMLPAARRPAPGHPVTAGGDARITAVGARLRRWKLDELPQLWNVVRGEMNLVGPRPEVPEFVDSSDPLWTEILEVAPGITGAASVEYFNEEERLRGVSDPIAFYRGTILPAKMAIEQRWLSRCSPKEDARLLLRTAGRLFGVRSRA